MIPFTLSNVDFFTNHQDKESRKKNPFYYDEKTNGYYAKSTQKKVTNKQLYKEVARRVARYEAKTRKLTNRFINGNISFEDWQKGMIKQIKESHVSMYRFGKGGADQTFANDYLVIARDLKTLHYQKFREFAQEIKEGKLSKSAILYRSSTYVRSSKTPFAKGQLARHPNNKYLARRRLGSCKEHCQPCIDYASLGWLKPSDITPIGVNCDCLFNDCCSIEFKEVS